jgi:hypothetical protein
MRRDTITNISEAEAEEQYRAMLRARRPRDQAEKIIVREMGDFMGYGRVMQLCEEIWHEKEIEAGRERASGAHTTGPCRAFMIPCPHPVLDDNGHCDICCGAGRITKGVAKLLEKVR